MALLVFDIGGTSVKYGVWQNKLINQGSFATPATWDEMKSQLLQVKNQFHQTFTGVAMAVPGVVKMDIGEIHGISAVPYLHHFPILQELKALFQLPVVLENDANAAGLAEIKHGVAKDISRVGFVVIGTGIGGAFYIDGQLYVGAHGYASEFGYQQFFEDEQNWSYHSSPVTMAQHYSQEIGYEFNGQEVYALAGHQDSVAFRLVNQQYDSLAKGLYNLYFTFDPERIVLGGAMTKQANLVHELTLRVKKMLLNNGVTDLEPDIQIARFGVEANLIGAVVAFEHFETD